MRFGKILANSRMAELLQILVSDSVKGSSDFSNRELIWHKYIDILVS